MQRQKIAGIWEDAAAFDGKALTVCGWARNLRDMKNFGFIELNDGSYFKNVQIVFLSDDYWFVQQQALLYIPHNVSWLQQPLL